MQSYTKDIAYTKFSKGQTDGHTDGRMAIGRRQRLLLCTASRSYKHQILLTLYAVFLSFLHNIFAKGNVIKCTLKCASYNFQNYA